MLKLPGIKDTDARRGKKVRTKTGPGVVKKGEGEKVEWGVEGWKKLDTVRRGC
jgi:hypothetical protein